MISIMKAEEYAHSIAKICNEYDIPSKISVIRDFVIESLENKSKIAELMGLTEENNFRKHYPVALKDSDIFMWCESIEYKIKYLLEQQYLNLPVRCPSPAIKFEWEKNTVSYGKTTIKITKLIMKIYERYEKKLMNLDDIRVFELIINELDILADCFGLKNDTYVKFDLNSNKLARIFDFIKNENGYAIFSINPVDMLTASYNTTFSSCFRPDGEYSASVLSMIRDSYTAILYAIKSQDYGSHIPKKYGRRWVHFGKTYKVVEFSKRYGTLSLETSEMIKNDIFDNMGTDGEPIDEEISLFSDTYAGGVDIFADESDTIVFADINCGYGELPYSVRIEPAIPVCLHCGSEGIDDNGTWCCRKCLNEHICFVCGKYGKHTLLDAFGGVCDHCLDVHFDYCDGCETYHNKNEYFTMYDFPGVGDVCLTWLTANGYNVCGKCSSIKPNSQLDKFPLLVTGCNTVLCKDCQEDEVVICDDCGEKHHKENMVFNIYETGDNICVGCSLLRMPYKGCSVCDSGSFRLKRVDQRHDQHEDTHFFIAISSLGFSYRLLYTGRIAEVICSNCQTEVHYDLSNGAKKVGERRFNSTII